jgi:tryptophanyl-tRNA synthetase
VQHLELSRVVARRWNAAFGLLTGETTEDGADAREEFFPEPRALLTPTRRIMGLDGQAKMSKSMGNTIGLLEAPESIWAKLRPAVTDPKRIRKTDPGTPEVCNIYHLHKAFSSSETVQHVATQCSTAGWGCIDCKKVLAESMETELVPIRIRAAELEAKPRQIDEALAAGADNARKLARTTMDQVRDRMGF